MKDGRESGAFPQVQHPTPKQLKCYLEGLLMFMKLGWKEEEKRKRGRGGGREGVKEKRLVDGCAHTHCTCKEHSSKSTKEANNTGILEKQSWLLWTWWGELFTFYPFMNFFHLTVLLIKNKSSLNISR